MERKNLIRAALEFFFTVLLASLGIILIVSEVERRRETKHRAEMHEALTTGAILMVSRMEAQLRLDSTTIVVLDTIWRDKMALTFVGKGRVQMGVVSHLETPTVCKTGPIVLPANPTPEMMIGCK